MRVVPKGDLPQFFRAAGMDADTRAFSCDALLHRLTVKEAIPPEFHGGPHRKVVYADGRIEGPFPVSDRPALSAFFPTVFSRLQVRYVLATVVEGTFWLNNKAQLDYLKRVPDAVRVGHWLRRRGLTDRFQGGFLLRPCEFAEALPQLAANAYAGGSDVHFTVIAPRALPLTAVACHHFDIHFASPNAMVMRQVQEFAEAQGLAIESLAEPEIPDGVGFWSDE